VSKEQPRALTHQQVPLGIVLLGSNVANNQPVTTKYLHYAKQNGAKIAVVNTFREPGLDRYWVPSVLWSAVLGTYLSDHWNVARSGWLSWQR